MVAKYPGNEDDEALNVSRRNTRVDFQRLHTLDRWISKNFWPEALVRLYNTG